MTPTPAPPIGYRYLTLGQARAQLQTRLEDYDSWWAAEECNQAIREALHYFQALTTWYRQRVGLITQPGNPTDIWYDLATSPLQPINVPPPVTATTPFGYNYTVQALASELVYALTEPQLAYDTTANTYSWAGSDQFNLQAVENAIVRRVNAILGDAGIVLSYLWQGVDAPPVSRFPLIDKVIDVRRASWRDAAFQFRLNLNREDDLEMTLFGTSAYSQPRIPQVFSLAMETPISIQVAPPPAGVGSLDLIAVMGGYSTDLTSQTSNLPIPVPDDFMWVVKWGCLADLMSMDGQARDQARADYAEKRYQQGVELARMWPAVMACQVGGMDFDVESVWDLDQFAAGWDALYTAVGPTQFVAVAGRNLVGLFPQPPYQTLVTLDVIGNIPVPYLDNDLIQIPREAMGIVIDYAQHVLAYRMAGTEFHATDRLHTNLILMAAEYNGRLRETALYHDAITEPSLRQLEQVPRI